MNLIQLKTKHARLVASLSNPKLNEEERAKIKTEIEILVAKISEEENATN